RWSILARVAVRMEARPRGFRPAPLRAPPQVLAASSGNRSCRLRPDLIRRMIRCGLWRRRVARRPQLDYADVLREVTFARTRGCVTGSGRRAWRGRASHG